MPKNIAGNNFWNMIIVISVCSERFQVNQN